MGKWREERVLSDGIFTVFSGLKSRPKQMAFPRAVFNVAFWGLISSQTMENWIQIWWVRIAVAVYYYRRFFWHSKGVCVVLVWTFHDTEKVGAGDGGGIRRTSSTFSRIYDTLRRLLCPWFLSGGKAFQRDSTHFFWGGGGSCRKKRWQERLNGTTLWRRSRLPPTSLLFLEIECLSFVTEAKLHRLFLCALCVNS